jgi:hypothetical protein
MLSTVLTTIALAAFAQGLPITDDSQMLRARVDIPPSPSPPIFVPIIHPPITGPIVPSTKRDDDFNFPGSPIVGPITPDKPQDGGAIVPDPYVPGGDIEPSE